MRNKLYVITLQVLFHNKLVLLGNQMWIHLRSNNVH